MSARIEIKVIPKGSMGFEEIAYTISQFREVETCYLMSGGYDLALTISGKTFKDIALFVAHRARAARTRPVDEHPLCAEKV